MDNYDSYRQVYKNTGTTPRTMNEAYRNANYAVGIYKSETETSRALKFLADALVGFLVIGLFASSLIGLVYFITHTV